ncbi:hypothetical protein ACSBQY_02650 [Micrococcus lylae]|uniref:Uncharacterized protein n=1 Tax=Micrococcus lylae TaxID=1273 RepID=A0A1R4IPI5_9MICC|nr:MULTISPECIES: hypothetical protein [Micrococcus]OFR90953.1 hypothetical protein HMPREF2863_05520 [Micrococcus sp. HMSC067E09]PNL17375.1 hypothetical protein CEQ11_003840 [Micrococcus sp. FDAARGOS_333]TFH98382.1 hypothetical protein E4A49_08855 [Micrococcus lylae]SJN21629.1 hypothetical protein FM125_03725 [Micrococcus lylae]
MKTIRTIAFILLLCATAFGIMLTLHYLPIPEILPSEITSWIPARGTADATWLIVGMVVSVVATAVAFSASNKAVERQGQAAT